MTTTEQRADEARSAQALTRLQEIRELAHEDFDGVSSAHESARENIRFIYGDQWDPVAKAARLRDKRPMLVFPKLAQFLDRVYGGMLQKRPSITVRADDQVAASVKAATESGKRIAMSEGFAGMMRQIDAINNAQIAYLNSYELALAAGFGHWRYRIDYKPYSFDQVILIEPVWDPFSVVWDQLSNDLNNDDAMRCLLFTEMRKKDFEAQYPGAVTAGFPADSNQKHMSDWVKNGTVMVAERFEKRPKRYRICELSDGRVVKWEDDHDAIKDELAKAQVEINRERRHDGWEILWEKVAGADILEEEVILPGENIPVVTTYGRRLMVEGKWTYRALHQHAKDEQRAYNYARTRAIEKVALSPLTPFIIGKSQVNGYEGLWGTANTTAHAFLPYDDSDNSNRPTREYGQTDLSGLRDIIQLSEQGLMSAIGQYEAALGQSSNEKSGRAVYARAEQSDQVTSPYDENYHVALSKGGRIVTDWLPFVYAPASVVQILNEDGTEDSIVLGRQDILDEQTGKTVILNDLSVGRYAVKIGTAPEFSTQRQEAVQGLTDFATAFPETATVIAPDILRNMDVPGAHKMARKAEALLSPEVRQAGEDDDGQQLPPQAQAAVEQAQAAMQQAEAMVQEVQQEAQGVAEERDALKAALAAEKVASEQAATQSKIDRERELLALERKLFDMQQRVSEVVGKFREISPKEKQPATA